MQHVRMLGSNRIKRKEPGNFKTKRPRSTWTLRIGTVFGSVGKGQTACLKNHLKLDRMFEKTSQNDREAHLEQKRAREVWKRGGGGQGEDGRGWRGGRGRAGKGRGGGGGKRGRGGG